MRQPLADEEKALIRLVRGKHYSGDTIAWALLTSPRQVATIAKHCREKGYPVCSNRSGYFYSHKEFRRCLDREEGRAKSILSTVRKAKKHSTLHPVLRRVA